MIIVEHRPRSLLLEPLLISTGVVALAEIGDKTQLLALVLAARFRKPVPIVLGILVATLLNHAFAGAFGTWLTTLLSPPTLRWVLGLSFLGMAVWTLIPDKLDEEDTRIAGFNVFSTTLATFFMAEMAIRRRSPPLPLPRSTRPYSTSSWEPRWA